ncbi:MAG: hypothetical protein KC464_17945 [Myxococcales bacterium]|nr:hypothetical protein [Myxococcales bacterium]
MRSCLLLVVACALIAVAGCRSDPAPRDHAVTASEASALLIDRNWVDVWPTDKDDRLHVYRFVPSMGGGVYHDRTVFQGQFELFTFTDDGREIEFDLPHNAEQVTTGYRIERVDGPAPFDLQLTLELSPRGPRVYYGIAAETGHTLTELDAQLARALTRPRR